jgi:hypothetical protein
VAALRPLAFSPKLKSGDDGFLRFPKGKNTKSYFLKQPLGRFG